MADVDFAEKVFPRWIGSLAGDVRTLAAVVARDDVPRRLRSPLVGALNYLFRALDIIPDWFQGLGFLDDAMVLRVGASLAAAVDAGGAAGLDGLYKLGNDADLVKDVLGDELDARFLKYVEDLSSKEVRGRSADTVFRAPDQLKDFLAEVDAFAADYKPAAYEPNDRYPEKLRQFMNDKLPR